MAVYGDVHLVGLLETDDTPVGRQVVALSRRLAVHPVYRRINRLEDIRVFMSYHVWCVWDFMSLAKAIQVGLGCYAVPWVPPPDAGLVHDINSIVTTEEADPEAPGGVASHFEAYLAAMDEVAADTGPIREFVRRLRSGDGVDAALETGVADGAARRFVRETIRVASGELAGAVAAFCLGREEIVPRMFSTLAANLGPGAAVAYPTFWWYLQRHILVDSQEHGPSSSRLFLKLVGMAPTPIRESAPTVRLPSTLAPAPTVTRSPIVGCRLPWSRLVPPSVTPW